MISTKSLALSNAALIASVLVLSSPAMAKIISVDSRPFEQTGVQWTGNFVDLKNDKTFQGSLPFQLNFGDGAKSYDYSFSENGFVQFVATGSSGTGGLAPSGNYIAPFAANLGDGVNAQLGGTSYASGLIDPIAPYNLAEATDKAFRFTWLGMCLAADANCAAPDYFQVILYDQGAGNFRIEFNYGLTFSSIDVFGDPTSLVGQQGYSLGSNVLALHTGPFNSSNPDYCFNNGVGGLCGSVVAVPEPETYALLAAGLVAVGGYSKRRRRAGLVKV